MLQITAHGNIGRDPEIKFLQSGKQVCNFSLAARTGQDETTWINCTVWGKRGQTALDYLKKGDRITVAGRGKLRSYQSKNGDQGQCLELDVSDFTLPKGNSQQQQQGSGSAKPAAASNDEIPF